LSNLLEDLKDNETIEKFVQLEAAFDAQGLRYARWSTARFLIEQQALYAQGRFQLDHVNDLRVKAGLSLLSAKDNTYTITECDGIKYKSAHQSLVATDYVILTKQGNPTWDYITYCVEYRALRDIGTAMGFNCGGNWMKLPNGNDSPYIKVNLGWDPPHIQVG
jgi:hypothetical protein